MNVQEAILEITTLKGRLSVYDELLHRCEEMAEGKVETFSEFLIDRKDVIISSIVLEITNLRTEVEKQINKIEKTEVKVATNKTRGRPRKTTPARAAKKGSKP